MELSDKAHDSLHLCPRIAPVRTAGFDFGMKSRAAVHGRTDCGFTLFELIVIVLILTVIVGLVGLNLTRDASDQVKDETQRLGLVLQAAQEEAILNGRIFALTVGRDGYQILTPDDKGKFSAIKGDALYQPHKLPDGIEISGATLEGQPAEKGRIDIVIDPTGLLPTFSVMFRAGDIRWQLEGLANGTIRSDRIS